MTSPKHPSSPSALGGGLGSAPQPLGTPAPPPILLTGIAGFIGSRVVEFLLADGAHVVGVDNHWYKANQVWAKDVLTC
jgi:hypothetical protein